MQVALHRHTDARRPTPQLSFFFLFTVATISVNYFLALIRDIYNAQYDHMTTHPERYKVEAQVCKSAVAVASCGPC